MGRRPPAARPRVPRPVARPLGTGPARPSEGPSGRKRTTPVQFTREVRDEMRQVAWPSRAELINYTSVVLTTLFIMIGLIFVLNLGFGKLITLLFSK